MWADTYFNYIQLVYGNNLERFEALFYLLNQQSFR